MTVSMTFVVKMYIFMVEWGTKSATVSTDAEHTGKDDVFVVARK